MVLRVKLEIVPFGDEDKAREIGRLDIFNRGTSHFANMIGANGYCDYGVISLNPGDEGLYDATLAHYRNDGGWELVKKVLTALTVRGPKSRCIK